ncbi:hypothetical protein TSOC_015386, partial [Tetrabaena socialis]
MKLYLGILCILTLILILLINYFNYSNYSKYVDAFSSMTQSARVHEYTAQLFDTDFKTNMQSGRRGCPIWILWMQGWDQAPLLARIVAASWAYHNAPEDFDVRLISKSDLPALLPPAVIGIIDSVDSLQAQSDVIRLSLLKHHGGVWADATMLCMMPLASWVFDAVEPAGFWMYRGREYGAGPASWFIVSIKDSYLITA